MLAEKHLKKVIGRTLLHKDQQTVLRSEVRKDLRYPAYRSFEPVRARARAEISAVPTHVTSNLRSYCRSGYPCQTSRSQPLRLLEFSSPLSCGHCRIEQP
jgi:hypothetical protein